VILGDRCMVGMGAILLQHVVCEEMSHRSRCLGSPSHADSLRQTRRLPSGSNRRRRFGRNESIEQPPV
jgi:carbonic anhydrase/acetyltransferase-like protein (isoleucine patch superfamily)